MLNAATAILDAHAVLVNAQRLVALADEPLVGLVAACGVGRDDQAREQGVVALEVGQLLVNDLVDRVDPVEMSLQVEVVPQAVAENKGNRAVGLAVAQVDAQTLEFVIGDRMADNDLNCESVHVSKG